MEDAQLLAAGQRGCSDARDEVRRVWDAPSRVTRCECVLAPGERVRRAESETERARKCGRVTAQAVRQRRRTQVVEATGARQVSQRRVTGECTRRSGMREGVVSAVVLQIRVTPCDAPTVRSRVVGGGSGGGGEEARGGSPEPLSLMI